MAPITGTKNVNAGQTILDMRGYIDMSWLFLNGQLTPLDLRSLLSQSISNQNYYIILVRQKRGLPLSRHQSCQDPIVSARLARCSSGRILRNTINDFKDQSAQT